MGTTASGEHIIARYDHDADCTLCIIEATKCKQMCNQKGLLYLLSGKKTITQAQREAYIREWNPISEEEEV